MGEVRILENGSDIKNFATGEILIARNPTPEINTAIMSAGAIITEEGGSTSHAAMIAREHKKPCIVGLYNATKNYKNGEYIHIDTSKNTIEKTAHEHYNIVLEEKLLESLAFKNIFSKEYLSYYLSLSNTRYALPLEASDNIEQVGGKAFNLQILKKIANNTENKLFTVPDGFTITTKAYVETILNNYTKLSEISDIRLINDEELQKIFLNIKIPEEIEKEIAEYYNIINKTDKKRLSVRSSATTEDTKESTFAGLHDTFLFSRGYDVLLRDIKKCWASIYSKRAQLHRNKFGIDESKALMAVVVQKMINSEYSGVIYTILTEDLTYYEYDKNKNTTVEKKILKNDSTNQHIKIEIVTGQGEDLVSGKKTPSMYIIDKNTREVTQITGKKNEIINIMINNLVVSADIIERTYHAPQDIEFCIKDNKLYVLQTRDIAITSEPFRPVNETLKTTNEPIKTKGRGIFRFFG